jgi:hypothetical protein
MKLATGVNFIEFFGVIYTSSGIFPLDFARGYTDSGTIMSKKSYIIDYRCRSYKTFLVYFMPPSA